MYLRLRDFRWFNQKMNSLLIMMEWLISFTEDWNSMETWACISVYNYFWFQGRLCSNWRVVTAAEAEKKRKTIAMKICCTESTLSIGWDVHTAYIGTLPYLHWIYWYSGLPHKVTQETLSSFLIFCHWTPLLHCHQSFKCSNFFRFLFQTLGIFMSSACHNHLMPLYQSLGTLITNSGAKMAFYHPNKHLPSLTQGSQSAGKLSDTNFPGLGLP